MSRWVAAFTLIGFIVGMIATFVFPALLSFEFIFRNQAGHPILSPSIFAVGILPQLIFGGMGALIGLIIYKIKNLI